MLHRKLTKIAGSMATVVLLASLGAPLSHGQNIDWQSDGSGVNPTQYQGKWEDTAHWIGGVVPGTTNTARWVEIWSSVGPAITTIDNTTITALGGPINVLGLFGSTTNVGVGPLTRRSHLNIVGTQSNPVTVNIGSLADPPTGNAINFNRNMLFTMTWANLNIIGTPGQEGLFLNRHATQDGAEQHVFTDSHVSMTAVAADRGVFVGYNDGTQPSGALLDMVRGSLTVTNATENARIRIQGLRLQDIETELPGALRLKDTVVHTNRVQVDNAGIFRFDNALASQPSLVTGNVSIASLAQAQFLSGEMQIGGSLILDRSAGGAGALQIESDTTLQFTGTGFATSGTGNWNPDLFASGNLSFAGTLRFSPDSVSTQNLLVFGEEQGFSVSAMSASNYAVGVLDLRDLVAENATLNLLEADNFGTNALYVDSLLMDAPLDPGLFFAGDINLYYNPATSDITGDWEFGSGGGMLLMIPEPGTVLLMAAGGMLMLARRRRQV